jgi:hypothetical protein
MMEVAPLKTSEFWLTVLAAVLQVAVNAHVVSPDVSNLIQQGVIALVAVVAQRVAHKTLNGQVPFVHPSTGSK